MLSGDEIRALRERLDLTQKELGLLIGVAKTNKPGARVRLWEAGDAYPCLQSLRHIRTLVAVSNALLALDLGRTEAAVLCLEKVFKPEGAQPLDERTIDKMERQAV